MAPDEDLVHYPCPACGSPLYGWAAAHDPLEHGRRIVVDRCETCGLGVTRASRAPDVDADLEPLLATAAGSAISFEVANGASVQASISGAQWAGLEPELRRLHFTRDSASRLLARRGIEVLQITTPYSRGSYSLMRQTLINAFTLRDNFLPNARAGLLPEPQSGREHWLRRLDFVVSWLVWLPCAIAAYPLERIGALAGRGGVLRVDAVDPGEADSS